MRFAFPTALWLLVPCLGLLLLLVREERRRRTRLAKLGDFALVTTLARGVSLRRRRAQRLAGIAAAVLLVVALAGPQVGSHTELLPQKGLDILFAIDVSRSMRARDVLPDRLERAKAEIGASLDHLGENRIGIVAFAGTAFVQCPLTTDKDAVRLFMGSLSPDAVPQGGTALAEGLSTARALFEAEDVADAHARTAGRVLVVVTDGEDHQGGVDDAAADLKQAGITVVLIGVGSSMGEPIPAVDARGSVGGYQKDRAGKTIMTRMAPDVLSQIAATAGGTFIDGTTRPDLGMSEVEAKVGVLEKRDLESRVRTQYVDRSSWLAMLAVLALFATVAIRERPRDKQSDADDVRLRAAPSRLPKPPVRGTRSAA